MSTDFAIEYCGDYLHVRLADNYEITPEGMRRFWSELRAACAQTKCNCVLSEGVVAKRRMITLDAFESGAQATKSCVGLKLACVFYGYVPDELTRFFQTVGANRGARLECFSCVEEALKWLDVTENEKK